MYNHFSFKSGSNPYITFTEKEFKRIMKKYAGKVEKLHDNFYLIHDI